MSKIGRNDPCPCGSGKKYKKCCMDKADEILNFDNISNYLDNFWSYEEVDDMSTDEIIDKLKLFGILFEKEAFLKDIERYYSAEDISENWFKTFDVTARDRDEDFPLFAAWVLWVRLAPSQILSLEQMDDLIEKGFEFLSDNESRSACDLWMKVWEGLKFRFKPEFKNMDYLDKYYKGTFFVTNFCQDLEAELYNAGKEDEKYFNIRINYCREFCDCFPEEKYRVIHNMRRAIAESYFNLGILDQAEAEYEKLVEDYPDDFWGYIGWGDMYFIDLKKEYHKAKEIYEKALSIAKKKEDVRIIHERLDDLKQEMDRI